MADTGIEELGNQITDADGYELCQCCGGSILDFIAGSMPEHHLCDDCGRGKCSRCIEHVRTLWNPQ